MSTRNLESIRNWPRIRRTRKSERPSPIQMTLQCHAYSCVHPALLTSRTPFECGLSPSCSPRLDLESTCFFPCVVPVLSLLPSSLSYFRSPSAKLGVDGCRLGNGLCLATPCISIPVHSTSRSTL